MSRKRFAVASPSARTPIVLAIAGVALIFALGGVLAAGGRSLPLGVHTLNPDDAALAQVQQLGGGYIVQVFPWRDIEPTRGEFHWEYTDWLVRAADYYGLRVIARLDQTPGWAAQHDGGLNTPPDNPDDYAAFAGAVAARYGGRIPGYIIWNEPNLAREWGGKRPDPAGYADLLKRAAAAVHAADPAAHIAAAGLAPTNENSATAMDDREFLRELYAAGGGATFDVMAAHPYPFGHPPGDSRGADGGLNFRRLEDLRDIMAANGDANKPIWISEFGYPLETAAADAALRVNESEQAAWTAAAYDLARREMPYVQLFVVWNLTNKTFTQDEQAGYSIARADGTPRPVFEALRSAEKSSTFDPLLARLASLVSPPAARADVPALAPDVLIHLGGSKLPVPWAPLYLNRSPSTEWTGEFYLSESEAAEGGWRLTMELMQVNMLDNRVLVNGRPVEPPYLPQEDFSSMWVTAQFQIPDGLVRPGMNKVTVLDSKTAPALASRAFLWDNLQIRNVIVRRDSEGK